MTTRLLSFVRSDDELALVLAHEMAHNILGHPARLRALNVPRGPSRSLGKSGRHVWQTEEEADRLAVKLLAAAGYDLGAVMPFWRRFYASYESKLQLFRTHPSLAARERIFRQAVADLAPAVPSH
jgi:predicted Zn-dependent protease